MVLHTLREDLRRMATVSSAPRTTTITLASATAGPFDVGFRVFDTDKLSVFVNGLPRADWSFVDFTFADGFCDDVQIEFFDALADGDEIIIDGDLTPIRGQDYVNGDPRLVAKMNIELARIWSAVAEVKRDSKRSVRGFVEIDPLAQIDPQDLINVGTYGDAFPSYPADGWVHFLTSGEVGLYMWMEPEGVWFEMTASSSGQTSPFPTRDAFVTWAGTRTPPNGAVIWAGGFAYLRDGTSTVFDDLPGYTWAGTAYLEHWGIVTTDNPANCVTDYTAKLTAALAAVQGDLLFTGWIRITDSVTIGRHVRLHSIRGHNEGGIAIFSDFNLSADCVLLADSDGEGGVIGDLGVWCWHTSAPADRSDLTQYPPILDLSDQTYFNIGRLRIRGAWDGIRAVGNFGGLHAQLIEMSAFNIGVEMDGALGFVNIENLLTQATGISSNAALLALYSDGTTIGAKLGRIDGGRIGSLQSYKAQVVIDPGYNNLVPLLIESLHLDGDGARFTNVSGRSQIDLFRSSKGVTSDATLAVSGGECIVGEVQCRGSEAVVMNVTGGLLRVGGGLIASSVATSSAAVVSAGTAIIKNVSTLFELTGRATAIFRQSGTGSLRVYGGDALAATTLANTVSFATTVAGNAFDAPGMIIPTAADNAAALSAGCIVGMKYKTASGEMRIVV